MAARQAQAPTVPSSSAAMPKPSPVPAVMRDTKAAVTEYNASYRSRYLDEVAPASIAGRLVKFSREGVFVTSDDDKPIAEGAEFIALCDQTIVGWQRFHGVGEPPSKEMGLLYEDYVPPAREALGDLDESQWDEGLDGKPADPWQQVMMLVLQDTKTSELFTFVTTSRTGRRAVGNLLRHFDRMQKLNPGELPVIRLTRGGFKHRDSRVGFVNVPTFLVCGRQPRDDASVPDTSIKAFLNDEVPSFDD
jgi:hypothetical protein